ncbi:hypothetical protein CLO_1066 [Clostridium botulinum E1 str. 'BoNT E Beluga']|nr:hypothetical protein CLO_1066 [Clostridium botulinum E1 str. 'BoNT E Beluga']
MGDEKNKEIIFLQSKKTFILIKSVLSLNKYRFKNSKNMTII